jgi:hypothetical protein
MRRPTSNREDTMSGSQCAGGADRRLALALGLTAVGGALATPVHPAAAQPCRPDEGQERGPGVRMVTVSERASMGGRDSVLPGYKRVRMLDFVFQPGAKDLADSMPVDMVCHMLEGDMRIDHRDGHAFDAKRGDVWTCVKGEPEDAYNTGGTAAIMRVILLMPS